METKLFTKRFDTGATADVSEDFTLPDYQPEIRRVIGVRAAVSVDGKYLTGDELETDGGVTYTVLYTDENGRVAETSQTSSYTGHIPLKTDEGLYGANDIVLSSAVENVSCRVTAPRRFTLSSRVRLSALSEKPEDCGLKLSDGDESSVRRKCETHRTACLTEIRKPAEVSGTIREQAGARIIMAQGEIVINDVRISPAAKNEATVKGDALITVLVETPDGGYASSRGRAPVDETVSLPDGISGEKNCAAAFANVVMTELDAAEDGTVSWRMEYDIDCDVMKTAECEITDDAYLTSSDYRLTVSDFTPYTPAAAVNGRLTLNGTAKKRPDTEYLTSWGCGFVDRCTINDGRLTVSGNVRVTLCSVGDGESATDEIGIPFRYECEAADGAGDSEGTGLCGKVVVTVPEITVRDEGENLSVTAETAIAGILLGSEQITAATAITPVKTDSQTDTDEAVIRLYVPDDGESAWEVRKKFRLADEAEMEGKLYIM